MAKTILLSPTGTPIFEDPGDLMVGEEGSFPSVPCTNDCPTDCSECLSTYSVDITGIDNPSTGCFVGASCSLLDGISVVFTRDGGSSCSFSATGSASNFLGCIDLGGTKKWRMIIAGSPSICQLRYEADLTDLAEPCCPPTDIADWTDVSPTCHGTVSIVAS